MDTEAKRECKRELKWASNVNSILLLGFYLIAFGMSAIWGAVLPLFLPEESPYFDAAQMLGIFILQYVVAVPVLLLVFRSVLGKRIQWRLRDCYHKPQATKGQVFRWYIMGLGLVYVSTYASNIFLTILQSILGVSWNEISLVAEDNWIGYLANMIGMILLAPLFEEMLFRATLFRNAERFGQWFGVIMTGIFFGLWHCNYPQIPYAMVLGFVAAFLTAKTKSVLPGMLVHLTMNTIGGIQSIMLSGIDMEQLEMGNMDYIMSHIGKLAVFGMGSMLTMGLAAAGLVLLILELCLHKETFRLENTCPEVKGGTKAVWYLTAPCTVAVILVFIGFTVVNAMGMEL